MKRIKGFWKIAVISLLAVLVLSFASCKKSGDGGEQTSDGPDISSAVNVSDFTLVYVDEAPDDIKNATVALNEAIKNICGYELKISTDWVKSGEAVPTDTKEIVVGNTNRRDTDDIRTDDFRVIREGSRIYILGGDVESTVNAVKYVIANLVHEKGLLIADKTDYLSEGVYAVNKLYFGNEEIKNIKIFTAATSDINKNRADGIGKIFTDLCGIKAKTVDAEADANVIIRDFDASKVNNGSWGTVTDNGRLELYCGRTVADTLALKYHISSSLEKSNREMKFQIGVFSGKTLSKEEFLGQDQLIIYPEFPESINRDYLYSVSVTQGNKSSSLPVYNHTIQSISRGNDGADIYRRFSTFAFSGKEVRVDIKVNKSFKSYSVMPSAKNFRHEFKNGVISVYLDKPDYFLIRLDDSDNSILSVFADLPEYPYEIDTDDKNTMVIDGWVNGDSKKGNIEITEDNTVIYVTAGSVLNAKLRIKANNVSVLGRGAIVDPFGDLLNYNIAVSPDHSLIHTIANNTTVDGLHLLNSRKFNIQAIGINHIPSEGIRVYNTKILSSEISTDGITFCDLVKDALAEHCFVYCGDNALVYEENCTYRDITIGTTCASLYPQTDVNNAYFEDIYIFRSDDGIIDNIWNGSLSSGLFHSTIDCVVNGIDIVDCTLAPTFFKGFNQGVKPKHFTIKNVSLGKLSDQEMKWIILINNGGDTLFTENYDIDLVNIAIDGKIVNSFNEISSRIYQAGTKNNSFSYKTDGAFTPSIHNKTTVNYNCPNEVIIGKYTVAFKNDVIIEGDKVYLPYQQIKEELFSDNEAPTVTKNGILYVSTDDLLTSGMVSLVTKENGKILITPKNTEQSLIIPSLTDKLSRYFEKVAYQSHMTIELEEDGTPVYKIMNRQKGLITGLGYFVQDEVQKFGEGTYRITAKIKASKSGKLNLGINYKNYPERVKAFKVDKEWVEISYDVNIKKIQASAKYVAIVLHGADDPIDTFYLKDLSFKKIS